MAAISVILREKKIDALTSKPTNDAKQQKKRGQLGKSLNAFVRGRIEEEEKGREPGKGEPDEGSIQPGETTLKEGQVQGD